MNIFKKAWIQFFYSDRIPREHADLLDETMAQLQEFERKSHLKDKISIVKEVLTPYGMPMGINNRQVIVLLRNYKVFSQYDLSIKMNHRYKVYFVKMWFNHLQLIAQFHLIDNQLYLSRTNFLTRLNSNQYECFLNGFIGTDSSLDKYTGILPYFVKDQQSTLIRIHYLKGYPSVTYYSGDKKIQTKVEDILKHQNLPSFSKN